MTAARKPRVVFEPRMTARIALYVVVNRAHSRVVAR
jgi:hypothetical protein